MTYPKIPVYQPCLNANVKKYVNECIDSNWISSHSSKGSFISRFEQAFSSYAGCNYAATVCNGTVALHLALAALGIGPGDEVLLPTLTYVATANAVAYVGATPVFVDSLPSTWQMDPENAARRITARTKMILAVHLYGHPCDLDALTALCRKHNLLLVEDCAEAFGTTYKGKHVGTFGHAGTFSFFGNKTITTGEGGMVVCNEEKLYKRMTLLRGQGVSPTRHYWHEAIGYNYRMTNICAAIGLAQLEVADRILDQKRWIAKEYENRLCAVPLEFHREIGDIGHSYWMCSALTEQRGIETRPFFYPVHFLPMYLSQESYPVAESLSLRGLNLPSFPDLTETNLSQICNCIQDFYSCQENDSFSSAAEAIAAAPQTST